MQHKVVCKLLLKVVCGSSILFIVMLQVGQSVRLTSALENHFFEKSSIFCTAPDSLILHHGICSRHTTSPAMLWPDERRCLKEKHLHCLIYKIRLFRMGHSSIFNSKGTPGTSKY